MPKQPHTATAIGRRVRIELKGPRPGTRGEVLVAKFLERTAKKIVVLELEDGSRRRVRAGDIKAFSDYHPQRAIGNHRK